MDEGIETALRMHRLRKELKITICKINQTGTSLIKTELSEKQAVLFKKGRTLWQRKTVRKNVRKVSDKAASWLFLVPTMLFLGVTALLPLLYSVYLSF